MAERLQSNLGNVWIETISLKKGWNNYVSNHWTVWADGRDVDLESQQIKKRKQKRTTSVVLHGKAVKDIFTYKKRYKRDLFTEWYEKRALPSTHWTIMEFKHHFKRKRPDYAKSFTEKSDNTQNVRRKKSLLVPESLRTMDNWFIEREWLPKEKNQKRTIVVERILDASGKVQRVTLLFFGMDVMLRQEDKISTQSWSVTERKEVDIKIGPQQMINLKLPWSVHIRSVAQCC